MLGKQWTQHSILSGARARNIVERGKGHLVKHTALRGWGLRLIMESPPIMLQFALLHFYAAVIVYLWDLNISVGTVILAVTSIGLAFYSCTTVVMMIRGNFPFPTIFSDLLLLMKNLIRFTRVRLRRGTTARSPRIKPPIQRSGFLARIPGMFFGENAHHTVPPASCERYSMTLSNPLFWRQDPLFTPLASTDPAASAGFWLLENSIELSAASAVAAVFSEIQWPSHYHSMTVFHQFHDTYAECFRTSALNETTRLRAVQSAAAYYVVYHTQLIWNISASPEAGVQSISSLSPDLFLQHGVEWGGDDVFEYLLRIEDRSEPVASAQFLSYIAPYWFCGDSDDAIRFRPPRLQALNELIHV